MSGGGEYEPKDSRKVVGTKGDLKGSWHDEPENQAEEGEYEPIDQRNVTGQASEAPDRWRKDDTKDPPPASGAAGQKD